MGPECSKIGYIGQLQKLQNRAAGVITGNFNRSTPSHLIIKNLGWLNITNRHNFLMGCLMHKCYMITT